MPARRIKARIADQTERVSRFRPKLNRRFALGGRSDEFKAAMAQLRQRMLIVVISTALALGLSAAWVAIRARRDLETMGLLQD